GPHVGNRITALLGAAFSEAGFRALHLEQGWCQLSFPSMHTSTQYGTFAEECDRLAKEAQAERHRMVLKEMAEAWRKLAEEADRRRGTTGNTPPPLGVGWLPLV